MFRSSNPALNSRVFQDRTYGVGESMTLQGAVNKCFLLLFCLLCTASWVWSKVLQPAPVFEGVDGAAQGADPMVYGFMIGGLIGGLILALITSFKPVWSPVTAPLYALAEGFAIGGISAYFESVYPGIVMQAVCLTFGVMFCMLGIYKSGLITVTEKFRLGISAAIGAIFLVYMLNFVMGFFGASLPFMYAATPFGIGFSVLIVALAALTLIVDFDFIAQASQGGAPKYMEWYSAFALMVTLIWLYMEILRLLVKLQNRR